MAEQKKDWAAMASALFSRLASPDVREFFSNADAPGDLLRYGMLPSTKMAMQAARSIPGQPTPFLPSGEENPEATRYASQYLAIKNGPLTPLLGTTPARLFNDVAFDDTVPALYRMLGIAGSGDRTAEESARIQAAGDSGARQAMSETNRGFPGLLDIAYSALRPGADSITMRRPEQIGRTIAELIGGPRETKMARGGR